MTAKNKHTKGKDGMKELFSEGLGALRLEEGTRCRIWEKPPLDPRRLLYRGAVLYRGGDGDRQAPAHGRRKPFGGGHRARYGLFRVRY